MSTASKTIDVTVSYTSTAGPEQMFDVWLDPVLVQQWFGPGLGQTLPIELDATVGGKFRIVQVRDGQPVGHYGEYLELRRPDSLAFTWAMDDEESIDQVRVEISAAGSGALVRLTHSMDEQWKDYVDSVSNSWTTMLTAMDQLQSGQAQSP